MNDKPLLKISVITPTFNRRGLLKRAVESVLSQTYPNFEHIIVNDGGESAKDIIEGFADSRLKYYDSKKNLGRSGSRNFALERATGDIICYLDDDDLYLENHFATVADFFSKNSEAAACYTAQYYCVENEYGEVLHKRHMSPAPRPLTDLYYNNFINMNILAHRKTALETAGMFNNRLKAYVDWDFVLQLSKHFDIPHVPVFTHEHRHRITPDNISHPQVQIKNIVRMTNIIYKLHPTDDADIIKKRESYISDRRRLKAKVRYLRNRIKNFTPDYLVVCGSKSAMSYNNAIIVNVGRKIDFILDNDLYKTQQTFLNIPVINDIMLNELMNSHSNGRYSFMINESNTLDIERTAGNLSQLHKEHNVQILRVAHNISRKTPKEVIHSIRQISAAGQVALFGIGLSGRKVMEFMKRALPEKEYFIIDDCGQKEFEGIKIVNTTDFLSNCASSTDFVICGKRQNLNGRLENNPDVQILRLNFIE
ncbi:glycosyltransferase [Seleniivibrio woodruffii]|uniref:glycosyltransferase family 2 protein n=1 Tax=Seleniivibrio woodruffii TaxID=1078050 RepID=UPI0026E9CE6B|nr:glycosyltransferase [Seleniivibrio woodruffii]